MIRIMSADPRDDESAAAIARVAGRWPAELAGLDPVLFMAAQERRHEAGTGLFRRGEAVHWMFYLLRGEAVLQRVTVQGTAVILDRAGSGFVAEGSLTSSQYHCDGVCRTSCHLLAFPAGVLRRAIDEHASTRWTWIALLGARLRLQRLRAERLALRSLRERLHHLVQTEGTPGGEYRLPGTRVELAAQLGVTPEALYRALAALRKAGILALDDGTIRWRTG
jgi:CRP-like cAMP-binding protein